MKTIVKMKFGSHLYGTNTKDSDTDYKGVFMPSKEQIYLGRIPKCYSENTKIGTGKNTSEDTDIETYSLHYFLKLACEGQTVAIDMLHAPDSMILETSDTWKAIVLNKHRFITKNMQAFIGYAMRQASKYGIKGSRLASAKKVIDFIKKIEEDFYKGYGISVLSIKKLKEHWDMLPEGQHIHKGFDKNGMNVYNVCGKMIQETASLEYLLIVLEKFYKSYGARAKLAERNEGIDWKAVSHAIRAGIQLDELYTTGRIIFPLRKAKYLRDIKLGKFLYKDEVAPLLENIILQVKERAEESDYPEKVDREYWEKFIMFEVERALYGR